MNVLAPADAWLRANTEPAIYVVFFGLFALLAAVELALERPRGAAARHTRWPANFVLMVLFIVVSGLLPVTLLGAADFAATNSLGLLPWLGLPPMAAVAAGFFARSFVSFGVHYLNHKVPALWLIHRVHHTDPVLDVSTTVRFHPLEPVVALPFGLAAIVLFGIPPVAVLAYEIFDAGINVWSHANIRVPGWVDRSIGLMVVTPNQHRIHHSAYQPETDSNFGATLNIWDRLFGTFRQRSPEDLAAMRLGLHEVAPGQAASSLWLLRSPLLDFKQATNQDGRPIDGSGNQAAGGDRLADPAEFSAPENRQ